MYLSRSEIGGRGRNLMRQAKNTICLWYDKDAEEAANFYAATFSGFGGGGGA